MLSLYLYTALLIATALERLLEMVVSRRNAAWAFGAGAVEYGRGHFPFMVALHTAFLFGCLLEPWLLDREFNAWLGLPMLAVAIGAQALRWWAVTSLGRRWNTRVIVVPGMELVKDGPYRWFRHPNYVAVVAEGIALPLIHSAWMTAVTFTLLNALLLTVRIRTEDRALRNSPLMEAT